MKGEDDTALLIEPLGIALNDIRQRIMQQEAGFIGLGRFISFEKEMRRGDVHNLVLTLRHEHQCNLQQAIQRAVELHDNEVRTFVDLETQLPSFGKK